MQAGAGYICKIGWNKYIRRAFRQQPLDTYRTLASKPLVVYARTFIDVHTEYKFRVS